MRTFLLSICLFICSLGLAADQDHVRKIITQSILCSDNAAQIVANYYTIPEGLSFEKIRDEMMNWASGINLISSFSMV